MCLKGWELRIHPKEKAKAPLLQRVSSFLDKSKQNIDNAYFAASPM